MRIKTGYLFIILLFLTASVRGQNAEIDSLKNLLTKNVPDAIKLKALTDLNWDFSGKDSKKSMEYAVQELKLANKTGDKKWIAQAYNDIGISDYKMGQLDSALFYYNKSLAIRSTLGDKNLIISSLSKIGLVNEDMGNYKNALEFHFKVLKLSQEAGNERTEGMTLNNICEVYGKLKNYDKEIEYGEKALAIHLKSKNDFLLASCYGNLSSAYKMKGDIKKADEYLNMALPIFKKYNDKTDEAAALNGLGLNARLEHKEKEALDYYLKAYALSKEIGDNLGLSLYGHNISSVNTELGNYQEAEKYSLESLKNTDPDNKAQQMLNYRQLATIYAFLNNGKKSEYYLNRYTDLKDSLFSKESNAQIANMEVKYQTEKKDKELVVKDAEITKQQADASKKAIQRNAFLIGFLLVLTLAFFIFKGYKQKQRANVAITAQKEIIEEKNKEITDSIHYARRIQRVLLASDKLLKSNLPEHFILYKPKDIVSGDFYWAQSVNDNFLICAADCTGHGVPGAFMSLLGISYLNEIIRERHINEPAQVLEKLRSEIIMNLNADEETAQTNAVNDGMDIVLCNFKFKEMKVDFACANNPLWLIRNNELIEYKPDKIPVGKYHGEIKKFTAQSIQLIKGDIIYILTDGYADQFGGEKGKKFKYQKLKDLLVSVSAKSMADQRAIIDNSFEKWKAGLEQVDDVLIIGIRV